MIEIFYHPRLWLFIVIVLWFTMDGDLVVVARFSRLRTLRPVRYRMPAIGLLVIVGRYPTGFV